MGLALRSQSRASLGIHSSVPVLHIRPKHFMRSILEGPALIPKGSAPECLRNRISPPSLLSGAHTHRNRNVRPSDNSGCDAAGPFFAPPCAETEGRAIRWGIQYRTSRTEALRHTPPACVAANTRIVMAAALAEAPLKRSAPQGEGGRMKPAATCRTSPEAAIEEPSGTEELRH